MTKVLQKTDIYSRLFFTLIGAGIVVCVLTELEKISPTIRAICGGDTSGCVEVGNSPYSSFLGIPLGYWGILSYITWGLVYRYRRAWAGLYGAVILGTEIFLIHLMLNVLQTVCYLCTAQFIVVALLNLLLFITAYPERRRWQFRGAGVALTLAAFLAFYIPADASRQVTVESMTSWGDPSSKVTLEIFSDYQCPYCQRFEAVVKEVMNKYPNVYILFRDFIISGHKYSPMAVAYSGSVAYYEGREKYLEERFRIFENQEQIRAYVGPRMSRVKDDPAMKEAVKKKVNQDMERARSLGVNATPTMAFLKDGKVEKIMRGAVPFEKVKEEIDALLSDS